MTVEEVDTIIREQGGMCAICMLADAAHIDHDHGTGRVRGVLCFRCNAALGQFGEQPAVLLRAARYLMAAATVTGPEFSRIELAYTERLAEVEFGTAS